MTKDQDQAHFLYKGEAHITCEQVPPSVNSSSNCLLLILNYHVRVYLLKVNLGFNFGYFLKAQLCMMLGAAGAWVLTVTTTGIELREALEGAAC